MSFPKYPKYKDSGVEWLGEVPEHWETKRLKNLLSEPLKYGANESAEDEDRSHPRFVRITDITDAGGLREDTFKSLPPDVAAPYLLQPGDVLLARSGATVGKSVICSSDWGIACFAGYLIRARLRIDKCLPKWFLFFCQTHIYRDYVTGSQIQATIQNVSAEKYASLHVPLPYLDEQHAIVTFLDRETAKIDALIAEQQRLIERLQEKRQAVISHAVTKGLNPDAPMKDSGIAWLGRIPSHWTVVQSRRLFALRNERARPADQQLTASQDHGVIYQEDFVRLEGRRVVEVIKGADILKHVEPQDFVISMRSFQGGIEWCRLRGSISSAYVMLIPRSDLHCPFFAHLFKSRSYIQALQSTSNLVRDGQALRYANFALVSLPDIPVDEQAAIAAYVGAQTSHMDALEIEAGRAVSLLQERRSALISAAVTGQIDVRNYASEGAAA